MIRRRNPRGELGYWVALLLPALLLLLFLLLRNNQRLMNTWVYDILRPLAQALGRLFSAAPFSVGEVLTGCFLLWGTVWLLRLAALGIKDRDWRALLRRLGVLLAAVLWVAAAISWTWGAVYRADTFTQRSGLEISPYSVEELAETTEFFARRAAQYSLLVPRDEAGGFAGDRRSYFARGLEVYAALEEEFPFLAMEPVACKPILFSRLQSVLGFTGVYFPLTGEANVNTHFPAFLAPVTMAHEMAHQRMVASEAEANFAAVAACLSGGDVEFAYSGYLLGLIQLCNALYPEAPEVWRDIVERHFTPELAGDWNENSAYWKALESEVEEAAEQAYDAFLKSNGQELGMRSYGACVDLLVAYYGDGGPFAPHTSQPKGGILP